MVVVVVVVVDLIYVYWYLAFNKLIGDTNKVIIRIKKRKYLHIKIDKKVKK